MPKGDHSLYYFLVISDSELFHMRSPYLFWWSK